MLVLAVLGDQALNLRGLRALGIVSVRTELNDRTLSWCSESHTQLVSEVL